MRKVTPRQFSAVSVSVAQGAQARLERLARIGLHIPKGLTGNGLNRGERILDPMLKFAEQKVALLFCLLAISYVAKHDAETVPRGNNP